MIWIAIAAAATVALLAGGQSRPETPPPTATPQLKQGTISPQQDQKNPYVKLIVTPPVTVTSPQIFASPFPTPPQWRVECGAKLMVVNPDLDPKILVTPQAGAPEPRNRRIAPPPCPGETSDHQTVEVKKPR